MRIVKVHNYYLMAGGEDTVFERETALLRAHGNDVLEYRESNARIAKMNQASVALQTIWSPSSYRKLRRFLKDQQPDIAHFHNTFPLISPAGYDACRDLGIPVVQTLDNQRLMCPAASFYRDGKLCLDCLGKTVPWPGALHACYHDSHLHSLVVASMLTIHRLLRTWEEKVDVFLCSTRFYRDLFVKAGLPAEKIVVMPHFVWEASRNAPNGTGGGYALFVGRLDPEKGVKTLLEAWRGLDIPLKIRGSGRLESWARQFVQDHGMHHVEFVGRLEEQELSELMAGACFLVVPSEGYYETFGMVVVEAYTRGVPVIASDLGVLPEMVSDGRTGLVFESGNPTDLARKAAWLWAHPRARDAMGAGGLAAYRERFTAELCHDTLIGVYNSLLGLQ